MWVRRAMNIGNSETRYRAFGALVLMAVLGMIAWAGLTLHAGATPADIGQPGRIDQEVRRVMEHYLYPDAVSGTNGSMGSEDDGSLTFVFHQSMATRDPVADVVAWYQRNQDRPFTVSTGATRATGRGGGADGRRFRILQDGSGAVPPKEDGPFTEPRPVALQMLQFISLKESVTVSISRASSEEYTYILLTYAGRTE